MGIFGRKKAADDPAGTDDLGLVLLQGHDLVAQLSAAHADRWGLGTADRWDVDQTTGLITWTFPDRTATASVQIIGSFSGGSWMWAWANQSVLAPVRAASEQVREFGEAGGHSALTTGQFDVTEDVAADLVAIAAHVTRAGGFYRSPGATTTYMTFGEVTVTGDDGEVQDRFEVVPE